MKLIDDLKKHFKERRERYNKFKMKNVKVQRNINENLHVHYFEIGVILFILCVLLLIVGLIVWSVQFRMIWGLW